MRDFTLVTVDKATSYYMTQFVCRESDTCLQRSYKTTGPPSRNQMMFTLS